MPQSQTLPSGTADPYPFATLPAASVPQTRSPTVGNVGDGLVPTSTQITDLYHSIRRLVLLTWQLYSPRASQRECAQSLILTNQGRASGLGCNLFLGYRINGKPVAGGAMRTSLVRLRKTNCRAGALPSFPAGRSAGGGASGSLGDCFWSRSSADRPLPA